MTSEQRLLLLYPSARLLGWPGGAGGGTNGAANWGVEVYNPYSLDADQWRVLTIGWRGKREAWREAWRVVEREKAAKEQEKA